MKRALIVFLLVNLILLACAPAFAPTPTPAPSATSLPTATTAPTSTATPNSTPAPTATSTAAPTASPTPALTPMPIEIRCFRLHTPENGITLPAMRKATFIWQPMPGAARYQLQITLPGG